jgi:hypothetical protein
MRGFMASPPVSRHSSIEVPALASADLIIFSSLGRPAYTSGADEALNGKMLPPPRISSSSEKRIPHLFSGSFSP